MKIGFFLFLSSVYDYVNLYASFDIKDNTDMIKFRKSKTDSPTHTLPFSVGKLLN